MTAKFFQEWRDGCIHRRTRSAKWLLNNLINENGRFHYLYQISTPHAWIDHEKIKHRVMVTGGFWIDCDTPAEALAYMAAIEKMVASGMSEKEAWEKVDLEESSYPQILGL